MCFQLFKQSSANVGVTEWSLTQVAVKLRETDTRLAIMEKNYSLRCNNLTNDCKKGINTLPKFQLLSFLRRRRMLMKRRSKIAEQREELFKKVLHIEQMQVTNDHVETLKRTLAACKELVSDLNVEDIEKVVDDLNEVNETMNEVCNTLDEGSPLLGEHDIDMNEIEEELDVLSREISLEFPEVPKVSITEKVANSTKIENEKGSMTKEACH